MVIWYCLKYVIEKNKNNMKFYDYLCVFIFAQSTFGHNSGKIFHSNCHPNGTIYYKFLSFYNKSKFIGTQWVYSH